MSQPNPFAAAAPQAAPDDQQANPFATAAQQVQQGTHPVQQAAAAANPFGAGVPTQQPPAPAVPTQQPQYGAPQQQVQQWTGTTDYAPAPGQTHRQRVEQAYNGQQALAQGQHFVQQATAQPQQWQQQAPAAAVPQIGQLAAAPPPVVGGGKGPSLADMYSRLVIIFPLSIETVPRNPQFITAEQRAAGNVNQERLTATVVVLDSGPGTPPGGTIPWGGAPHQLGGAPHTNNDSLPYVRRGMWINQSRLISQARPFLPAAGQPQTPIVGRVAKTGPENNAPWYLIGASPEEQQLAQTYLNLVANGQYPHPLG